MKKTVFTVLLSVFIIYLVSSMLFTPKSDAFTGGGIPGPIDFILMCCTEIQSCCVENCKGVSGTKPFGAILLGDVYTNCLNSCIDEIRYVCDAFGEDHT